MMQAFCAGSNLRISMELPGCPKMIRRCLNIVEGLDQEVRGTFMSDIITMGADVDADADADAVEVSPVQKAITLDTDIQTALETRLISESGSVSTAFKVSDYPKLNISGLRFSEYNTTNGNGTIFFQPTGTTELVPAVIRRIFCIQPDEPSIHAGQIFLAIHRFRPSTTNDPFAFCKDYGASLWEKETSDDVEVIRVTQRICHANQQNWQEDVVVMRPTLKARTFFVVTVILYLI
jgi:hypothetical protein